MRIIIIRLYPCIASHRRLLSQKAQTEAQLLPQTRSYHGRPTVSWHFRIFALVMWLVYYVSVSTVGTWATDWTMTACSGRAGKCSAGGCPASGYSR